MGKRIGGILMKLIFAIAAIMLMFALSSIVLLQVLFTHL